MSHHRGSLTRATPRQMIQCLRRDCGFGKLSRPPPERRRIGERPVVAWIRESTAPSNGRSISRRVLSQPPTNGSKRETEHRCMLPLFARGPVPPRRASRKLRKIALSVTLGALRGASSYRQFHDRPETTQNRPTTGPAPRRLGAETTNVSKQEAMSVNKQGAMNVTGPGAGTLTKRRAVLQTPRSRACRWGGRS